MRKSRVETAETRRQIVSAAAAEFRRRGAEVVGVAEIMAAVGMTHGGFYRHFASKGDLLAEAVGEAMGVFPRLADHVGTETPDRLGAVAARYLSAEHRDDLANGCPLAALGGELARADSETRRRATAGLKEFIAILSDVMEDSGSADTEGRALAAASILVGALTLSRLVDETDLSDAILQAANTAVAGMAPQDRAAG